MAPTMIGVSWLGDSRNVVGCWQMSDRMTTYLVLSTLEMDLWRRDVTHGGLVFHSDKRSR